MCVPGIPHVTRGKMQSHTPLGRHGLFLAFEIGFSFHDCETMTQDISVLLCRKIPMFTSLQRISFRCGGSYCTHDQGTLLYKPWTVRGEISTLGLPFYSLLRPRFCRFNIIYYFGQENENRGSSWRTSIDSLCKFAVNEDLSAKFKSRSTQVT